MKILGIRFTEGEIAKKYNSKNYLRLQKIKIKRMGTKFDKVKNWLRMKSKQKYYSMNY